MLLESSTSATVLSAASLVHDLSDALVAFGRSHPSSGAITSPPSSSSANQTPGKDNTAAGSTWNSVSGGSGNGASGLGSSVSGGSGNTASSLPFFIGGDVAGCDREEEAPVVPRVTVHPSSVQWIEPSPDIQG